jgi:hypothetical protein
MKNQNFIYRNFFIALMMFALALAPFLTMPPQTNAGGIDLKALNAESEAKSIAQYVEGLTAFFNQAETLSGKRLIPRADVTKFENEGRRIKSDASNFRSKLQALIAKLKAANRWNEQLDADIAAALGNRKVKGLLARGGGARKLLETALNEIGSLDTDIDSVIGRVKANSASSAHARAKFRVKCAALFAGVAVAELLKMKLTAENIDAVFDKNCGPGGGSPAT